jgi:hypothetical protein
MAEVLICMILTFDILFILQYTVRFTYFFICFVIDIKGGIVITSVQEIALKVPHLKVFSLRIKQ